MNLPLFLLIWFFYNFHFDGWGLWHRRIGSLILSKAFCLQDVDWMFKRFATWSFTWTRHSLLYALSPISLHRRTVSSSPESSLENGAAKGKARIYMCNEPLSPQRQPLESAGSKCVCSSTNKCDSVNAFGSSISIANQTALDNTTDSSFPADSARRGQRTRNVLNVFTCFLSVSCSF